MVTTIHRYISDISAGPCGADVSSSSGLNSVHGECVFRNNTDNTSNVYLLNPDRVCLQEEIGELAVLLRHVARAAVPANGTEIQNCRQVFETVKMRMCQGRAVRSPLKHPGDDM